MNLEASLPFFLHWGFCALFPLIKRQILTAYTCLPIRVKSELSLWSSLCCTSLKNFYYALAGAIADNMFGIAIVLLHHYSRARDNNPSDITMSVACREKYWINAPDHLLTWTKHWIHYWTSWICHLCFHISWNFIMCLQSSISRVLLLQGTVALSLAICSRGRQLVYLLLMWGRVEPSWRKCKLYQLFYLNEEWSTITNYWNYCWYLVIVANSSLTSLRLDNSPAVLDSLIGSGIPTVSAWNALGHDKTAVFCSPGNKIKLDIWHNTLQFSIRLEILLK